MRRSLLSGLGVVTLACVAAGCGSSSSNGVATKSPTQILHAAVGAMRSAKSVHIAGTVTKSGKTVGIDATIFSSGDISGTVTEDASNIGVVKIGKTDYLKAPDAFYKTTGASAQIASLMSGKWIELPDSEAGFGNQFTLVGVGELDPQAEREAVARNHLDAQWPAGRVGPDASNGGTLYVATTGPAYPLRATNTSQTVGSGTITFTQWNQGKLPTVPPGARTVASFG